MPQELLGTSAGSPQGGPVQPPGAPTGEADRSARSRVLLHSSLRSLSAQNRSPGGTLAAKWGRPGPWMAATTVTECGSGQVNGHAW